MSPLRRIGKTWYSDIYVDGKRVRRRLSSDKRVAEEKLATLVLDREALKDGRPRSDISWETFKPKYLDYCFGSKAKGTALRDRAGIRSMEKFLKPRSLADISPESLERWKAHLREAGKGNATINKDMMVVKAMMRRAKIWGYLKEWDGSSVKKLREARGRLLFYTPEELGRLLAVCRSRLSGFYDWTTICLLGARAGLRRSEIYWLAWQDVNLERGTLQVTPKEGWQPKSGESRHVPISKDLSAHLRKLKRQGEWVIGERPSLTVMSAFFQKISRKAKLDGNIHTLRHTFASHLAQSGVDLYTISKLLGHTDPKVTTIYAHLAPDNYSAAVAKLPAIR